MGILCPQLLMLIDRIFGLEALKGQAAPGLRMPAKRQTQHGPTMRNPKPSTYSREEGNIIPK